MKYMHTLALGAAAIAALAAAVPASAKPLTPEQRARLQNEIEVQRSIQRDLDGAARDLDRAYKAAKAIDRVIDYSAGRVPGGRAAYRGGKAVGDAVHRAAQRRRH